MEVPPKWCIRGASFLVQIALNSYVRRRRRALKRVWVTYGVFFFPALITRYTTTLLFVHAIINQFELYSRFFFFSVEEYQCPCLELWTRQWFTAPYSWHLLFFAAAWIGNQCSTHPSKSSSSQKRGVIMNFTHSTSYSAPFFFFFTYKDCRVSDARPYFRPMGTC